MWRTIRTRACTLDLGSSSELSNLSVLDSYRSKLIFIGTNVVRNVILHVTVSVSTAAPPLLEAKNAGVVRATGAADKLASNILGDLP